MGRVILSSLLLLAAVQGAGAGDPAAGKEKSVICAACHGATGVSEYKTGQAPILAGQYADYIVRALKDYKSGQRDNPVMKGLAAALSEQDMEDIAAYFSRQEGLAAPHITKPVSQ